MRGALIVFGVIAVALVCQPGSAAAQSFDEVPRVGFLISGSPTTYGHYVQALREGLEALGHVEGREFILEPRFAMGKHARLTELAAELVSLGSDVIVVTGAGAARAARKAGRTVPIVVAVASDLVKSGIVASLARPGGNTTGMTAMSPDLSSKQWTFHL